MAAPPAGPALAFPPRRILAAVDFSDASRAALTMAARLAVQCHAELHVLHAEDPQLCAAARADGADFSNEVREELGYFLRASALPAELAPRCHVVGGQAADVICDIATREDADVIVMAARGISRAERFMGSTAEAVLRHARVPLLVVPHAWTPPVADGTDLEGMAPVIVGVDFTEPSLQAMTAAGQLAALLGARLELVHIVSERPVIDRWQCYAARCTQQRRAAAEQELLRLAAGFDPRLTVTTRVDAGLVAAGIAAAARTDGGRRGILILGRRRAAERGDAPGAIAYRVITLADVPTLVFIEPPD